MRDIVIRAKALGKCYRIGHNAQAERYTALRDVVARTARNFARSARDMLGGRQLVGGDEVEEFWALRNLDFEIKRGDVVGIIGRNGAGKSTLLKILSRIAEPTTGRVEIKGRVASLLEVGTGFHPELTGRENIYLNGAILGMTRAEIRHKFDEIVAFAEIEKFLDTPVKRYSSGMYVRLAFAVAAHLEPEILIVDEVLAVGDVQFQQKCLGKMQDVANKDGRTVLFVSHTLSAVRQLCKSGLLLEKGALIGVGTANAIADLYLGSIAKKRSGADISIGTRFTHVSLVDSAGSQVTAISPESEAYIELEIRVGLGTEVSAGLTIYNQLDVPLVLCASGYGGVKGLTHGEYRYLVKVPSELLPPGLYRIEGAVWNADNVFDQDDNLIHFQVLPAHTDVLHGRSSSALYISRDEWSRLH